MDKMAGQIIESACRANIPLEINEASKKQKNHFWKDFWDKAGAAQIIHGVDAHALSEVKVI